MTNASPERPILYSFRRCPYAMRARLALQVAGIQCEIREIVLQDKAPALLEASPKGTVPVLVLESSEVLEESLDIAKWALEKNDPAGWLSPPSGNIEEMQLLIERLEPEFKYHLDRYKYAYRYDKVESVKHRDLALSFLNELNERLDKDDWLFGVSECWADVAIAPFVRQFAHTDRAWFYAQPLSGLQTWLKRFLESNGLAAIMLKYPVWREGDEARRFP